jgi:hypothetical protein
LNRLADMSPDRVAGSLLRLASLIGCLHILLGLTWAVESLIAGQATSVAWISLAIIAPGAALLVLGVFAVQNHRRTTRLLMIAALLHAAVILACGGAITWALVRMGGSDIPCVLPCGVLFGGLLVAVDIRVARLSAWYASLLPRSHIGFEPVIGSASPTPDTSRQSQR